MGDYCIAYLRGLLHSGQHPLSVECQGWHPGDRLHQLCVRFPVHKGVLYKRLQEFSVILIQKYITYHTSYQSKFIITNNTDFQFSPRKILQRFSLRCLYIILKKLFTTFLGLNYFNLYNSKKIIQGGTRDNTEGI